MPPQDPVDKRQAAREVIDILQEISDLLSLNLKLIIDMAHPQNTNLDRTELSLCVSLIENGVNPDALATVIKDLRKEAANNKRFSHAPAPATAD
ncbi:Mitotic-spindle organizing protein 1 [Penicillium diatomitis]|uniref:Mitotic-spindle organizing protein 1 n=1 Tax=Penicillium diatomitis TaxID=2819901 RepID=A0A9X0BYV6_9EURO|nr:Mitotic-spindle organizing protein 1 [Penicillium diatomitis]KAJ5489642.1 Mitotic-spindle organizing protein 1 [Penicillium diatomitis]